MLRLFSACSTCAQQEPDTADLPKSSWASPSSSALKEMSIENLPEDHELITPLSRSALLEGELNFFASDAFTLGSSLDGIVELGDADGPSQTLATVIRKRRQFGLDVLRETGRE